MHFFRIICVGQEETPELFFHSCSEDFTKGIREHEDLDVVDLADAMDKGSGDCIQGSYEAEGRYHSDSCQGCGSTRPQKLAATVEDVEEFCRHCHRRGRGSTGAVHRTCFRF